MSESAMPPCGPGERWLPAVGWEGLYEVSDHGRVWSVPRRVPPGRMAGGHLMTPTLDTRGRGYWVVSLTRNRKMECRAVHRLVAMAFLGPIPPGMEVLHGSAGSQVNHISNLSIGTHRENILDKYRDGTMPLGENHHGSKLTEADVIQIRARYAAGEGSPALGRAFGISPDAVRHVLTGKTWGHVPGEVVPVRVSRGEALSQAKLTAADIPVIRARCAAGELQKDLAVEYGVCKQAISNIVRGVVWKHVA